MEEILASIRRIIADDQSLPGHGGSPLPLEPEAPHAELPHAKAPDAPVDLPPEHGIVAAPQFVSPEGPASVMDTPHPLAPPAPDAGTGLEGTGMVGEDVPALHEPALQGLDAQEPDAHEAALHAMHDGPGVNLHDFVPEEPTMTAHEVSGEAPSGLFSAATSQSLAAAFNTLAVSRLTADSHELRGLAQEMLRPLLKDWLDENLPSMVEGIIRDEIDRMAHGGR